MIPKEPAELLEWDSEFFGFPIGRVRDENLTPATAPALVEWARDNSVKCLYFLASANDTEGIRTAEAIGFRFADVRMTRGRSLEGGSASGTELARSADLAALRKIARTSHRSTRFYHDPNFPDERCDALYMRWIQRALELPNQEVLVVRSSERAVGYVVCSDPRPEEPSGQIGLIAVASSARGSGMGGNLVRGAMAWLASRGCGYVEVVSQGRNVAASRLYERLGFITLRMDLWFHLWLDEGKP